MIMHNTVLSMTNDVAVADELKPVWNKTKRKYYGGTHNRQSNIEKHRVACH